MPDVKDGQYEKLLEEMLKRWTYATDQLQDIRAEATTDMRYVSGNPWDDADRRQREDAGRPVLSLDELGQYTNQLINDVRQHKRAIKVTPLGSGANDDTAELRADLIRQIEYRSNAQQAYTSMFENTVQRGYGFCRVKSQWATTPLESGGTGQAFNQELVIEPIVNPDTVTIDPDALKPDGSDMRFAWVTETWSYEDYRKKFPKARVQDFDVQLSERAPMWMKPSRIQLAEYWTIEEDKRTLLLFKNKRMSPDGQTPMDLEVFEDDLEEDPVFASLKGVAPDKERQVEVPIVKSYLTNGFEVLGTPDRWPGKSIPLVCCYGKVLYVDDGSGAKRQILSLVRLARDPYMLYCYYRTTEAELIGMTPKVPYFVRRGSLKPDQLLNLQKSLHEPIAVIEVEGASDSMPAGQAPEMPQRNPYVPEIQAMEMGAEGARRAIQAAMGISPLPTAAQRQTEKSGVALKQIHDAEQQGSFHFVDSYEAAITRVGVLCNDVLDVYYDTARDVTTRNGKGEPNQVRINDPAQGNKTLGRSDEHDVTLSTGPSYDSEREAANDYADLLTQNVAMVAKVSGPPAAAKLLSLAVKLKNLGPIGDEIADLLSPPQPEGGLPPQVQQAMQQLQQQNQALQQQVATDAAKQQAMLQKAQMDNASAEKIAAQKTDADLKKQWIAISAQLLIAAGKVGAENARSLAEALDKKDAEAIGAILDVIHKDKDQTHEHIQGQLDRTHELQMAQLSHAQALQQGAVGHEQALEQGDQGHQQALEQGQQAAALAPEPATAQ
jgi:hypothetical protein